MENLFQRKSKKNTIDYENNEEQDWISYIHRNLTHDLDRDVPFPDSSWSYARHDSVFEMHDALKKSDDSLREDVNNALYESKSVDASCIHVEVINGNVALSGDVSSSEAKEKAQKVVEKVDGVWKVSNELRVVLPS